MCGIYLALKDNLLQIFLENKRLLSIETVNLKDKNNIEFSIVTARYDGFFTVRIGNITTLIVIPQKSDVQAHQDFINVTKNERFRVQNIINGYVFDANVVIEGSDGVGKSTLVYNLAQIGVLCQDRAVNEITRKMKPEVDEKERFNSVKTYLNRDINRKIVFIYMSDEEELRKRIYNRGVVSEFDKKSVIFQRMYIETFEKLKAPNLFLVDCLNKSQENMVEEIIKLL